MLTHYRLWDSDRGFVDVEVTGWLQDAIAAAGMPNPRRAQFLSQGQWIDVSRLALNRAIADAMFERVAA
jgi:hypothetical protein